MNINCLKEIQGVSIKTIADTFGTPFYVYDSDELKNSYLSLRSALPNKVDIFYSLKANPNISICSYLGKLGARAEVCSLAEIETVISAGFLPEHIICVGPAKTEEELKRCIEYGILAIVCESLSELRRISTIAKSLNKVVSVALRINPDFATEKALLKMGGKPSQFGMDIDFILAHEREILAVKNVNIIGIHIYNGTRILDEETVYENTKSIFSLADTLMLRWNKKFSFVDIGGGLGIPYFNDEKSLDMESFGRLMKPLINEFYKNNPGVRIVLESGRFLVGKSGTLVTKINNIKTSKGENFLITDGGTNCHMAAVGIGSFIKRNFPVAAYTENESNNICEYSITGPLCTPGDIIARKVSLPEMEIGDLIGIHASGAYGPTASPVNFLSHGYPAEIMVVNSKAYLIRARDTVVDILSKQNLINFN